MTYLRMSSIKCLFFLLCLELSNNISLICCWAKRFNWLIDYLFSLLNCEKEKMVFNRRIKRVFLPFLMIFQREDDPLIIWTRIVATAVTPEIDTKYCMVWHYNVVQFNWWLNFTKKMTTRNAMFTAVLWDEYWAPTGDWGGLRSGEEGPRCVRCESSAHKPGVTGAGGQTG